MSKPEIEFDVMKEIARHWACTHVQKRWLFRQRQLSHKWMLEGDYRTRSHTAEPYSCLQVWVLNGNQKKMFPYLRALGLLTLWCVDRIPSSSPNRSGNFKKQVQAITFTTPPPETLLVLTIEISSMTMVHYFLKPSLILLSSTWCLALLCLKNIFPWSVTNHISC